MDTARKQASPRIRDHTERRVNPLLMMTFWLGVFFLVLVVVVAFGG